MCGGSIVDLTGQRRSANTCGSSIVSLRATFAMYKRGGSIVDLTSQRRSAHLCDSSIVSVTGQRRSAM